MIKGVNTSIALKCFLCPCSLSLSLSHTQIAIDLLPVTVDQFAFSGVLCKQNLAVCILFLSGFFLSA